LYRTFSRPWLTNWLIVGIRLKILRWETPTAKS